MSTRVLAGTERRTVTGQITTALWVTVAIMALADPASGQGPTSQSRVDTSKRWEPARLPDGQPNVEGGMWRAVPGGTFSLINPLPTSEASGFDGPLKRSLPSRIVDPPDGRVPYQPWAAARQKQQELDYANPTRPEHLDSQHRCLTSTPRLYYFARFRIIQPSGFVVFAWDGYHQWRVIPLDDGPRLAPNVKLWMGDARGRWEGNTLVVDTTNHNGKSRLSISGDFFSENVRLRERFTFTNADTMTYEVTIEDPTVFTRPWTMRVDQKRGEDEEMWENACHEGVNRPGAIREDDRILKAGGAR